MAIGEEIDKILKADKTVIPIDIGIGPPGFFDITRSVVLTWGIMAVCLIVCLILTSGLAYLAINVIRPDTTTSLKTDLIIAALAIATASAPMAMAFAKSEETRSPPVITRSISDPMSSRYFLARASA